MRRALVIELLYVPGCPCVEAVRQNVDLALSETEASAVVRETVVEDERTAQLLLFPGSPTVRVNGCDIQPSTALVTGLGPRTYVFRGRFVPVPPVQMLAEALVELLLMRKAS